ncbi:MAG: AAA family ATPase, partial [Stackebrandtia sp.]
MTGPALRRVEMAGPPVSRFPEDMWTAAVHAGESRVPLGAAVVVDERRLLTSAHVVTSRNGTVLERLWVTFPKADAAWRERRDVARVRVAEPADRADVAVLVLEQPVPRGVDAAPLRCPRPTDLVGQAWSAFGFADRDPIGGAAAGSIGAALGFGWVRLDTGSRYPVAPGFSGTGLWSPEYCAVVAVVGHANDRGDGRAFTLHQADLCLPGEGLREMTLWTAPTAGESALFQWGWTLAGDPEAGRHWRPRARGVAVDSERGYRFRGRTEALHAITGWLDRDHPDRRVLVVTGSPGVGKSAVLGRVVTTADAHFRATLPTGDDAIRATVGSVACAVHAKGKTALEIAAEIAKAASAAIPERPEDVPVVLREVLSERGGWRFNLIIDALDEAASPAEARTVVARIVLPVAQTCADVGAQVVVGIRRRDAGGELLAGFGGGARVVDLDDPTHFNETDLQAYSLATLQLAGDERPRNAYIDTAIAEPVAERIARLSDRNFLIAGLVARTHGMYDTEPVSPGDLAFTATVDYALDGYLDRLPNIGDHTARDVLTVLAYADTPGVPLDLWRIGLKALNTPVTEVDLARFARSTGADFLIEHSTVDQASTYRLFHQALSETLLRTRDAIGMRTRDQQALTRAFVHHGRTTSWANTHHYLLRSLPQHAGQAGLIDELLRDDEYLLNADLHRLAPHTDHATTSAGKARARLLRLTPQAARALPSERAGMFSVTDKLDKLSTGFEPGQTAAYRTRWARAKPRTEHTVLEGHIGSVAAVCPITVSGRELLATASHDGTVRV